MASKEVDSPPRKKKWLSRFQDNWLRDNEFSDWLRKKDELTAVCEYCKTEFTIKYEGKTAINTHKNSKNHKIKSDSVKMSRNLTNFVTRIDAKQSNEVSISE